VDPLWANLHKYLFLFNVSLGIYTPDSAFMYRSRRRIHAAHERITSSVGGEIRARPWQIDDQYRHETNETNKRRQAVLMKQCVAIMAVEVERQKLPEDRSFSGGGPQPKLSPV
jgi:hypothetical protein